MDSYYSTLTSCVDNLSNSNGILHASLASMTTSTQDFPRLIRILASERCYELVSEDEIYQAQLDIRREVEPQIKELIARAEEGLEHMQRNERSLNQRREERSHRPPVDVANEATVPNMELAKASARLMALQTQKEALLNNANRLEQDIRSKKVLIER